MPQGPPLDAAKQTSILTKHVIILHICTLLFQTPVFRLPCWIK